MNKYQQMIIEDLRTTDAKQTRSCLHRIDKDGIESFCCLGRMCVTLKDELNLICRRDADTAIVYYGNNRKSFANDSAGLPKDVRDALKMHELGYFKRPIEAKGDEWIGLAQMNDSEKFTFKELAEIIAENPDNVFYAITDEQQTV